MLTIKNSAGLVAPLSVGRPRRSGRRPARSHISGLRLVLVALGLALLVVGCAPPGPRALLKGKKLLDQGKYTEAVAKLRAATALLGTNAQAFNYLGIACHHAGQFGEAQKAYQAALALNHDFPEAHYNLGCLWLEQSKLELARSEFIAYTLRCSNSAEGWLKLGSVQLRVHEPLPAEKSFSAALKLNPAHPEAFNGLGLARLQRNRPAEAAEFFNRALKAQPNYPPALLNLGIVSYAHLNDRRLALTRFREYLALKPVPENAAQVQALVREMELDVNRSARPFPNTLTNSNIAAQRTIETNLIWRPMPEPVRLAAQPPKPATTNPAPAMTAPVSEAVSPPAKSVVAPVQSKIPAPVVITKPTPSAPAPPPAPELEVVKLPNEPVLKPAQDISTTATPAAASSLEPTNAPPAGGRAMASAPRQSAGASNDAASPKRGFLQKINPANLFAADPKPPLAAALPEPSSKGPDRAAETSSHEPGFPRYAYRSPAKPSGGNRTDAEVAFAQGVEAQQSHRLPEARQAYRRATQLDPSFFDAWYNLGLATAASGDVQTALLVYETALSIRPESLDARYNFGLVLKQANFVLDAAREFERILSAYPNESRAHLALGNIYAQQLQQPAKARPHYIKVLEIDPRNPEAANIRYWLTYNAK